MTETTHQEQEAQEQAQQEQGREVPRPARYCGECGAELPIPGLLSCYGCMEPVVAVAVAKAYHQTAFDVLRGVDRAQVLAHLADESDFADAAFAAVQENTPALEKAVKEAVAAERAAQDRARAATEHSRKCAAAEKRAQREQGSPHRQTEALARARAAADVTQRHVAALEGATAARVAAEQALAAHHTKVAELEDAAEQARRRCEHPPAKVGMSVHTAFTAHPLLVLTQPDLTAEERAGAILQVKLAATLCGLEDSLRAEGRAALKKEQEEAIRNRPMHIKDLGNGQRVAVPNPLAPGTPQQFHPPARRP
jgi:hypothetical protein